MLLKLAAMNVLFPDRSLADHSWLAETETYVIAGVVAMSDRVDDSPRPSEAFPTASGPIGRWAECGGDYSSGVLSFMRKLVS